MPFLLKLSFVIAIAGHGADLASTENCLGRGVCTEMNTYLARFNNPVVFGTAKMGVAAGSEVLVYDLSKNHPNLAILTNMIIGGTFMGIAIHNAQVSK